MERTGQPEIVYLDTHVVLWLYDRLLRRLSPEATRRIEGGRLFVSPLVELEIAYLHEIGRVRPLPRRVLDALSSDVGLRLGDFPLGEIVRLACGIKWTRDPFDRLIVAETTVAGGWLVTRDAAIRRHFDKAVW